MCTLSPHTLSANWHPPLFKVPAQSGRGLLIQPTSLCDDKVYANIFRLNKEAFMTNNDSKLACGQIQPIDAPRIGTEVRGIIGRQNSTSFLVEIGRPRFAVCRRLQVQAVMDSLLKYELGVDRSLLMNQPLGFTLEYIDKYGQDIVALSSIPPESIAAVREQMTSQQTAQMQLAQSVKVGDTFEVTIKNVLDYGAFVQATSGLTALIHRTEVGDGTLPSWPRLDYPKWSIVVARVIEVSQITGRVSMSLRDPEERKIADEKATRRSLRVGDVVQTTLKVGDVKDVVITNTTDYGAFVITAEGDRALIHRTYIDGGPYDVWPNSIYKKGDSLTARVVSVENNRIAMSLRADEPANVDQKPPLVAADTSNAGPLNETSEGYKSAEGSRKRPGLLGWLYPLAGLK